MRDLLGFNGITEAADQILEGKLFQNLDEECFPGLRQFIAAMAVVQDELKGKTQMNMKITEDDFRKGMKEWKETTFTSPSNRHLGHYKVARLQVLELTQGYAKMINIPVKRGFSPSQWQNATSVMIEKDKGSPKINRLCIIHLFEADYNLFHKLIWGCHMVGQAEEHGKLGEEMQGSR